MTEEIVTLEVQLTAQQLADATECAYQRIQQRATVRGFRRGRAPRAAFEAQYGRAPIMQAALEELLPDLFAQAVQEAGIDPISEPTFELDLDHVMAGQPAVLTITVVCRPRVNLSALRPSTVQVPTVNVSEEDVDLLWTTLQERAAWLATTDGPLKPGLYCDVTINIEVGGEPWCPPVTDYLVQIGGGQFHANLEQQLVGLHPGDMISYQLIPSRVHSNTVRDKEAVVSIEVVRVWRKEVPMDDDLAALCGFSSAAALRGDLRDRVRRTLTTEAEHTFVAAVLKQAAQDVAISVPERLVRQRVQAAINAFDVELSEHGTSLQEYLDASGRTFELLCQQLAPEAVNALSVELLLDGAISQDSLIVSDVDVDRALSAPLASERLQRMRSRQDIRDRTRSLLLRDLAVRRVVTLVQNHNHTIP